MGLWGSRGGGQEPREVPSGFLGVPGESRGVPGGPLGGPWEVPGGPWGSLGSPGALGGVPGGGAQAVGILGGRLVVIRAFQCDAENVEKPLVFVVFPSIGGARGDIDSKKELWDVARRSLMGVPGCPWRVPGCPWRSLGTPWGFQGEVLGVPGSAPGTPKPPREASVNPADRPGAGYEVARRWRRVPGGSVGSGGGSRGGLEAYLKMVFFCFLGGEFCIRLMKY